MKLSLSELSNLTGFTRETCKKRLEGLDFEPGPKAAKLFESKTALAALYEAPIGGQIDLMRERALLARSQRTKIDLEVGSLQKDLLPASLVERVWAGMTGAARSRLLALPYRLATAATAETHFAAIEAAATDLIREALEELHSFDPNDYQ